MENTLNRVKYLAIICISLFLYAGIFFELRAKPAATLELPPLQQQVTGTVTDKNSLAIPGVAITIKDSNTGTTTNLDGEYSISVGPQDVLVFTFLGMITEEEPVNGRREINVQLEEDVTALGEVEINAGYYHTTRRESTGNISRITSETIELQPVGNPIAAMQGHLSGVNIVQSTGVPGGGYTIEVRGRNFLSGVSDPLFIVDGVPYGSQSLGSVDVSGQITAGNISPLNAINHNDIESIEVLKDADATAIYGSRAANGVVLITTKKGKVGRTQFNVNLSSTMGQVSRFLHLMDTEQYLEVRREGIINDGYGSFLDDPNYDYVWPDVKLWDTSRYTDWQKELIGGKSSRNNAQVSVSGGNAQTRFLLSGAFQKETTVFPGDANYKKTTVHSNLNHHSQNDKFSLNLSTIYSNENNIMPRSDFTSLAYSLEPNSPELYDDQGNLNWENNTWNNPLASLEERYEARINTLIANTLVSYKIRPNLELKSSFGFNSSILNSYKTLPSSARNPNMGLTPQSYSNTTTNASERYSWIVEPQLNWKRHWKKIKLDILLGTTFQQENTRMFVQKGTGFPNNKLMLNLTAAETIEILQDADSKYNYNAIFARMNLNLLDRYILNLTGRRDGSSRFGPGRQFGDFGAVGAAWIFSEENFFNNVPVLSFGKLRGSYGWTGSDNIGDYRFLDTYNLTGFDYDGTTILEPTGIFNPLFRWETNEKLETALELGFLNDRLFANVSWYRNRSSNQLVGIPLAGTTGFSELTGNFDATVENSGFEIDVQSVNLQGKEFKWSTTVNFTIPKNKLLAFDGLEESTFSSRYIIGKPLTIVRLYHALGVDPETGLYRFEDYNGDDNISRQEDREWIEDRAPKLYGGLGNTLNFKNFTVDFFFQFKKQKAFNELAFGARPGQKNGPVSLLDRWQQQGDFKPIQMASAGLAYRGESAQYQTESSAAFSDASFIRLRNISLNYKVPELMKGLEIDAYLQGQNLLTFTNYKGPDPEQPSNGRLAPLRQITLGLQLGF